MGISGGTGAFAFGAGVVKTVGEYCPTSRSTFALGGLNTAGAANAFCLTPFIPAFTFSSSNLYLRVTVAGGVGTLASVAVYSSLGNSGLPYQLLSSATGIAVSSTGIKTAPMNNYFAQGVMYWVGYISNGTANIQGLYPASDLCSFTNDPFSGSGDIQNAHTYGTIPSQWPYGAGTTLGYNGSMAFKFSVDS